MDAISGDWQCPDCGGLKKARWPDCRKCGTEKRPTDVLRAGDWLCFECGLYNKGRKRCAHSNSCHGNYKEATVFVKQGRYFETL